MCFLTSKVDFCNFSVTKNDGQGQGSHILIGVLPRKRGVKEKMERMQRSLCAHLWKLPFPNPREERLQRGVPGMFFGAANSNEQNESEDLQACASTLAKGAKVQGAQLLASHCSWEFAAAMYCEAKKIKEKYADQASQHLPILLYQRRLFEEDFLVRNNGSSTSSSGMAHGTFFLSRMKRRENFDWLFLAV